MRFMHLAVSRTGQSFFGSSNAVCHGTMEEVIAWLADDNNVEAIAMMLQDLYENTRTWD